MELEFEKYKFDNESIFGEVVTERIRQDTKFGANRHQHPLLWLAILGEEVGEVNKATLEGMFDGKNFSEYRKELIEVAAVCFAMIQDFDRYGEPEKE